MVVGELEGAEAGLDQGVHQADHQKGVGDFLEDLLGENLQVHLPGYLMEKGKKYETIKTYNYFCMQPPQESKGLTLAFQLWPGR